MMMAYGRKVRRELEQKVALAKMNKELCGEDEIIFNIPIDLGSKLKKVSLLSKKPLIYVPGEAP